MPVTSDTQTADLNSHRPSSPLHDLMYGHVYASALRAVALHGIADQVADTPRPVADLAEQAGLDAGALRRVLRLLAARGLFLEDADGAFALTDAGQALRTDAADSQHAAVLLFTDEMFRSSAEGIESTLRTGEPSFDAVHGRPLFDHLAATPDKSRLFNAAMTSLTTGVNEQLTRACPFPEEGTVVDVGGGRGGLLREVLTAHPDLTGILFDQPQTVADHLLDTGELRGRWRTQGGDFFTTVPEGGDLYLLKNVLHDWPDEDCLRILHTIRRAVVPGTRLLVIDAVLPGNGTPHPALALDMVMLMTLKGRERTAAEFEDLLATAGFRLHRIVPTEALSSVLEAEAV
ncbi:methyltransferase [Streptomyces ochraceiscleroticus]|uniref:Methyltransferase n=1 Tax=Streptomyces ochraceiscleroticus TaxID=47761 RepID=A0ABW1MUH5_9ACTN|nr:methyltransferase [Streptomyces ochraceiscleroticus]